MKVVCFCGCYFACQGDRCACPVCGELVTVVHAPDTRHGGMWADATWLPLDRAPEAADRAFLISGAVDRPVSWTWDELLALPSETPTVDIDRATKWSKLDTLWKGVSVDTLMAEIATEAQYVSAWCDDGYTTTLQLADVTGGAAWLVYEFAGQPLAPEHGGPARLLVPQRSFWKSAKWVRGLALVDDDDPGLWRSCERPG